MTLQDTINKKLEQLKKALQDLCKGDIIDLAAHKNKKMHEAHQAHFDATRKQTSMIDHDVKNQQSFALINHGPYSHGFMINHKNKTIESSHSDPERAALAETRFRSDPALGTQFKHYTFVKPNEESSHDNGR